MVILLAYEDRRFVMLFAVEGEASKIRIGQYFKTFRDFDRCLDSYCVLKGRVAARYATKHTHAVRVCRFGPTKRNPKGKSSQGGSDENQDVGKKGDKEGAEIDMTAPDHESQSEDELDEALQNGVRTATPVRHPHCDNDKVKETLSVQNGKAPSSSEVRAPLGPLNSNTVANSSDTTVQHAHRTPWLLRRPRKPDANSGIPAQQTQAEQSQSQPRKQSVTGAGGQLSRLLPSKGDSSLKPGPVPICPFRVRAQREFKTGRIHISICNLTHTCPQFKHKWRGPTRKSKWLGETLASAVVRNTQVAVKELQEGFQMDYKKVTSYRQMHRGREHVKDWYLGGQRASFHKIPALLEKLKEVDPNCVTDWSTMDDGRTFKRAFVCPSATRNALQYCQPVLCLDACHTKNRKYPTQLFLATLLDGSAKIVILAWAIAPSETKENWIWFLELLQVAIHGINAVDIPLMSDRQKGLLPAVQQVFPDKIHSHCAHHLKGNVRTNFGKRAATFFISCVYAKTKQRCAPSLLNLAHRILVCRWMMCLQ